MFEKITGKLEAAKTTISTKPLSFGPRVAQAHRTYREYVTYMMEKYGKEAMDKEEADPSDRVLRSIMLKMKGKGVECEETYTTYLTADGNIVRSLSFVRCHRQLDVLDKLRNTASYMLTCAKNNQSE